MAELCPPQTQQRPTTRQTRQQRSHQKCYDHIDAPSVADAIGITAHVFDGLMQSVSGRQLLEHVLHTLWLHTDKVQKAQAVTVSVLPFIGKRRRIESTALFVDGQKVETFNIGFPLRLYQTLNNSAQGRMLIECIQNEILRRKYTPSTSDNEMLVQTALAQTIIEAVPEPSCSLVLQAMKTLERYSPVSTTDTECSVVAPTCPICLTHTKQVSVNRCGHLVCIPCLHELKQQTISTNRPCFRCPVCRADITQINHLYF